MVCVSDRKCLGICTSDKKLISFCDFVITIFDIAHRNQLISENLIRIKLSFVGHLQGTSRCPQGTFKVPCYESDICGTIYELIKHSLQFIH